MGPHFGSRLDSFCASFNENLAGVADPVREGGALLGGNYGLRPEADSRLIRQCFIAFIQHQTAPQLSHVLTNTKLAGPPHWIMTLVFLFFCRMSVSSIEPRSNRSRVGIALFKKTDI